MRVVDGGELHALSFDQLRLALLEPAVLHRLLVERRAGIGRGQRHLDGVRIDLLGELDGLLDRLAGFAGQAEDEGAVDRMPSLRQSAVKRRAMSVRSALLDVVQDLLVAGLVADQQQPQAVSLIIFSVS